MRAAAALAVLLLAAVPAWALSPFYIPFASGSARLDARAFGIIDNAAEAIRALDVRQLEVAGFADRVGSSASNMRLSRRRAEAVKAALVARGVAASAIRVQAFGEDRPLVETGDGVDEPQNRFVTITLVQVCRSAPFVERSPGC